MRVAKILLLGEIGVGKTSLARRLVLDTFETNYKATIGTDIYRHEIVPSPIDGPFQCVIWDTDGNFGDTIFRHVYAKQADAAVIIGDVTRPSTLEAVGRLGEGFMDAFPGRPMIFVVNKLDTRGEDGDLELPASLKVDGIPCIMTSAKTGHHVREAFRDIATVIARRW